MALAIVESLPVHSPWVPSVLESIINKKVAEVALNKIEELIDWLFTWLYSRYTELYNDKRKRVHSYNVDAKEVLKGVEPCLLFDRTREGQFSISDEFKNTILLGDYPVFFGFSRLDNLPAIKELKWIIAENDSRPDYYRLVEKWENKPEAYWEIYKKKAYENPEDGSRFYLAKAPTSITASIS